MSLYAIEVLEDHVHLFLGIKPTISLSKALHLFKAFPEIKQQLWGGHLWSRGKFFRSVGSVTAESIRESQS